MAKIAGYQLSLITDFDCEDSPVGDYHFDELGSEKFLFGAKLSPLGSNYSDVSVIGYGEIGQGNLLDPNPINQHLPLGWLEQKPIKNGLYWYWRYYKNTGVRASLYCGKDYTKAFRKVLQVGYPADAKRISIPQSTPDPQKVANQAENTVYCFPVADSSDYAA